MIRLLRQQKGVAMIEAMLAVVLLAIGLIGAIGIQGRSIGALSDATMRAEATIASESLVGLMQTDQLNIAAYAVGFGAAPPPRLQPWYAETQRHIPNADVKVVVTGVASPYQVDVTIKWTRAAGQTVSQHRLVSHIAT